MAIQVIQERSKGPSKGQILAGALQNVITSASQAYQERQKKENLSKALQNIEGAYQNPELSEQQRLIQTYQQLSGQDPQLANQLGGYLSRLGGQQEGFRNKIMGEEDERDRLNQSVQKLQGVYADPELTEEQKFFATYQELSQNPTLAKNIIGSFQQQGKARDEGVSGDQFSRGYDAILSGDNEELSDVLRDKNTPLCVKRELTNLRDKTETRKSVQARELRARQSQVERSYKQAIDALIKQKGDAYAETAPVRAKFDRKIKRLEALRGNDLRRLTKNPNSYEKLSLWNNLDADFLPEEEGEMENEDQFMEPEGGQQKIKFNPKDPEHVAIARKALQEAGGDRAKANEILSGGFSL